ncbi:OmpA family protein [Amycolatopsis rubida]|uniref:OmpA family protein n=1 Tax=Amycolatopsis rubida TaxID=112413 RepID=A0A1I5JB88_9PSEU|nr:OmpA family protein [Amycolatopsis rubida]SFO69646.1 OmpA family protein [Amycolatopsis rubida]
MSGLSQALERELVLAEGADLARRGDYEAAAALLEPDSAGDPARLDLLARVHAQSGDLAAADAAWAAVLALRPGDSAAEAGRRVIAKVHSGRLRRRPVRRYLLTAGAVVVLGAAIAGGVVLTARQSPPPPVATVAKSDGGLRAELDRLHGEESRDATAAKERQEKLKQLAETLAAPGVSAKAGSDAVIVSFDRSLFSPNATTPNEAGRTALTDWARVLKGQSIRVTVIGHGVAVPGGPASGGSTVSLARASAAARVLAAESGLPLTAFAVSSADQGADSARTVTLEVRPTGA